MIVGTKSIDSISSSYFARRAIPSLLRARKGFYACFDKIETVKLNYWLKLVMQSNYEQDFYGWVQTTLKQLRDRDLTNLDWDNLIEEIESLGKQEKRELVNRLIVLLMHLLKWEYQPEKRSKSWFATIKIQRIEIIDQIESNPSLKSYINDALVKSYRVAILEAVKETGLSSKTFPEFCPYAWSEIQSDRFFPGIDYDPEIFS